MAKYGVRVEWAAASTVERTYGRGGIVAHPDELVTVGIAR